MNKGKLEVVKQEMTRVNIDILGISELRWTGMGEFNSDDHYIYYCGQESLRRNAEEAEVERFYEDLQDLLEIMPPKRCPFHYRGLECKVGSQETPGVTGKFGLEYGMKQGKD